MHIPDGFLSPVVTLPAWAVATPLWWLSARRGLGGTPVESVPVVGSLTALAFVLQGIAIPVPGGTSVHLSGAALLAILYGPATAFACQSLVLLLQAVLLGAGGVTVLPVNAIALGLAGPGVAWLVHRALVRASGRAAAFAGAWAGTQAATLAVALVLGLQHRLAPSYMPVPFEVTVVAMMVPSLAVLGVVEGLYTVAALSILRRARLVDAR